MDQSLPQPLLELASVRRSFQQGERRIDVLQGASARIYGGEAVALVGPSGAGKSSLLHVTGLLEKPDGGTILVDGLDCSHLDDDARTAMRRGQIGFIYQFHQLLPEFTAAENIVLPQLIAGRSKTAARKRAEVLLAQMGLADRANHRPAELSGGEQQRVAIARGVANNPKVLLADEPTGNLDPETAERVFGQLIELVRSSRLGALIATHNMDLAARMDRVLKLEHGKLHEISSAQARAIAG